jgi:hypothetical protein
MPKGKQERIQAIVFNYHCYECDQHKEFQTEKMRDKFFLLHQRFCKCEEYKGGATTNFNNRKPNIKIK